MFCKICDSKTSIYIKNIFDNRHGYPGKFHIYKCTNCGFMQTKPQLTFGQLSNVYTKYYPKRDADIASIIREAKKIPTKKIVEISGTGTTCHFKTRKGQKVLDVGCGTCQSLLEIKRLGGEPWGLDPDKNSEKVAKKLKLKFHLGTIHNCPFPKKYFDLITASQVIEHEGDPINFLKDCKMFLKDNGKIILSFPNTDSLYRKIWGKNWLHWHIPYHLNHFNKKSVKILAERSDLKIASLDTITPNLWTVLQLRLWINSPKMGQRDPMWDGSPNIQRSLSPARKTASGLMPFVDRFLALNRIIDSLGFGESFVITLKN